MDGLRSGMWKLCGDSSQILDHKAKMRGRHWRCNSVGRSLTRLRKPWVTSSECISCIWEVRAGRLRISCHLCLCIQFEASLDYVRTCLLENEEIREQPERCVCKLGGRQGLKLSKEGHRCDVGRKDQLLEQGFLGDEGQRSVTGVACAWRQRHLNLQSSRLACYTSKFQASLLRPCLKRSPALKRKTLAMAGV